MTNSQLLLTYMQKSLSVSVCTSQQNKKEGFSVMQCCLTAALLFSSSTFEYAEALEERRTTFPGGLVRKEILLVCDAWTTTSSWALREATSDLCSYDYFLLRGGEPECVCLISACVCAPVMLPIADTHTRLLHSGVAAHSTVLKKKMLTKAKSLWVLWFIVDLQLWREFTCIHLDFDIWLICVT